MRQRWQETVAEVEFVHLKYQLSIRNLADKLEISIGKACNDLRLAAALRVYPQLEKTVNYTDAMKFVKKKKFQRKGN